MWSLRMSFEALLFTKTGLINPKHLSLIQIEKNVEVMSVSRNAMSVLFFRAHSENFKHCPSTTQQKISFGHSSMLDELYLRNG